ncbi:hypothetical protein FK535_24625 [Mycolicibacterium sp. 018/SC-01/001]|uniref:hypothetical protein n=1 Tax=Mycolicibacterium sp. 018/SC-01/001 TaxID=2592069 RepID=UPI00117CC483|nr:hypothetical protein [Mycolicibacterium sp. 018/SC-01/001]TRW78550.1 hypothetical protein FK535_24625 [Mycolicibacterium sp. 018/SC-01/001]
MLLTLLHVVLAALGIVVVSGLATRHARAAGPPVLPDLTYLTEAMLVDQSAVPSMTGTQWATIVASPQGGPAPVRPAECGVFLSQGDVTQKALGLRSMNGAAIGVELALTPTPVRIDGLADRCASFSLTTPALHSETRLAAPPFGDVPAGSVAVLMHTRTSTDTQSLAWDIAMIVGVHRGVLVTAEYTPGPRGGRFDPALAAALPDLYRAQVTRLDKS